MIPQTDAYRYIILEFKEFKFEKSSSRELKNEGSSWKKEFHWVHLPLNLFNSFKRLSDAVLGIGC